MTGDQLKRWRENRNLTQDQLAAYLGGDWTRQRVANVELERTTMVEDLTTALGAVDAAIGKGVAPNSQKSLPKRQLDYSRHKCWDLAGNLITMDHVLRQSPGFHFYRMDNPTNRDPDTHHQIADLWETTRAYPRGQCCDLQLDLVTWDVLLKINVDNPRNKAAHPKLQAAMQGKRDALERARAMVAAEPGKYELDETTLNPSTKFFLPPS